MRPFSSDLATTLSGREVRTGWTSGGATDSRSSVRVKGTGPGQVTAPALAIAQQTARLIADVLEQEQIEARQVEARQLIALVREIALGQLQAGLSVVGVTALSGTSHPEERPISSLRGEDRALPMPGSLARALLEPEGAAEVA